MTTKGKEYKIRHMLIDRILPYFDSDVRLSVQAMTWDQFGQASLVMLNLFHPSIRTRDV
jgi:hypothetical protein